MIVLTCRIRQLCAFSLPGYLVLFFVALLLQDFFSKRTILKNNDFILPAVDQYVGFIHDCPTFAFSLDLCDFSRL